jgi:hypothetical protein
MSTKPTQLITTVSIYTHTVIIRVHGFCNSINKKVYSLKNNFFSKRGFSLPITCSFMSNFMSIAVRKVWYPL